MADQKFNKLKVGVSRQLKNRDKDVEALYWLSGIDHAFSGSAQEKASHLLEILSNRKRITPTNCSFLRLMLEAIDLKDIAGWVTEYEEGNTPPAPTEEVCEFRKLIYDTCNKLSDLGDVREMSTVSTLPPTKHTTSALSISMDLMKKYDDKQKACEVWIDMLETIDREDLIEPIREYMTSLSGSGANAPDDPSPPGPGNNPTPPIPGNNPTPPIPGNNPTPPTAGDTPTPPTPGEVSEDEELPNKWKPPYASGVTFKTYKQASSPARYKDIYDRHLTSEQFYHMVHERRGPCLVLSNTTFDHMSDRDGNERDEEALQSLFNNLGFDVDIVPNKSSEEMLGSLREKVEACSAQKDIDCFVLIVLSHGENGVIFGTDGISDGNSEGLPRQNFVKVEEIRRAMATIQRDIPKLIFFQACREGSTVADGGEAVAMETAGLEDAKQMLSALFSGETSSDAPGESLPLIHNLFSAMSTSEGSRSYRNTVYGSWFIQAIVYVFSRFAYKYDLDRMMTEVNFLVSRAEGNQDKQISEKHSNFTKGFYFYPSLHGPQ